MIHQKHNCDVFEKNIFLLFFRSLSRPPETRPPADGPQAGEEILLQQLPPPPTGQPLDIPASSNEKIILWNSLVKNTPVPYPLKHIMNSVSFFKGDSGAGGVVVEGEDSPHPKYQLAFVLSHGVQSEITVKHINDTPTLSFGVCFFQARFIKVQWQNNLFCNLLKLWNQ